MNSKSSPHQESHKSHRAPWLRAAMLGVNDGIVSTASLMLGVLAASDSESTVLIAGIAGLAAGALSMAAGEYVSVSSQRDSELSDIELERQSIEDNPEEELEELAHMYERRGIDPDLALKVATQLHEHDAVEAHVQYELGIGKDNLARPMQAAIASAVAFAIGAFIPILAAVIATSENGVWIIASVSSVALFASGAVGAQIGGGHKIKAAIRVLIGGGLAMAITFLIGHLIGASI